MMPKVKQTYKRSYKEKLLKHAMLHCISLISRFLEFLKILMIFMKAYVKSFLKTNHREKLYFQISKFPWKVFQEQ